MDWMRTIGIVPILVGLLGVPARADTSSVAEFYEGKMITLVLAAGVSGGYGLYARLLSEFMPAHIPGNPSITLRDMQGSGGVTATNYVYNVAAKDGSYIGMPLAAQATTQALGHQGIRYNAAELIWLGRLVDVVNIVTIRQDAPAKNLDELRRTEVIAGTTRPGAPNHFPFALMNAYLSTKFKIVTGYKGMNGVALAYQRGEVNSLAATYGVTLISHPEFLKDTKLVQVGLDKDPRENTVPLLSDLIRDPKHKQVAEFLSAQATIGRAVFAPPGVPEDRVAALRNAFDKTMLDPAFRAKANKLKMDLHPMTGVRLQKLVNKHMATSDEIIAEAKRVSQIR